MKLEILSQLHALVNKPGILVRSSAYAHMDRSGLLSSIAQAISHFWPLDADEFLLASAMTPSERRILVRTRAFQSLSYGSLTDISMNSNGLRVWSDCPFKKSL